MFYKHPLLDILFFYLFVSLGDWAPVSQASIELIHQGTYFLQFWHATIKPLSKNSANLHQGLVVIQITTKL